MRWYVVVGIVVASVALTAVLSRPLQAASFQGLDVPGSTFRSEVQDLSADGSTVVGVGTSGGFRWTATDGIVQLGEVRDPISPTGVAATGETYIGTRTFGDPDGAGRQSEAFRWDAAHGFVPISGPGVLDGRVSPTAISSDGSVVVGSSRNIHLEDTAFRWDENSGWVDLGDLPGGTLRGVALDVSADGSVVVGRGRSASGSEAFRWDATQGMIGMGDLPGGTFSSQALAVSSDGSFIVGSSVSGFWSDSFRWHSTRGMVNLAPLGDADYVGSAAFDISADGSIVIGSWNRRSGSSELTEAMVWDETNGMRSLTVLLTTLGLDLSGWHLSYATAISADGLTIAGNGINPAGQTEAWIAVIPEPHTGVFLSMGLVILASGRNFRRKQQADRIDPIRR